MKHHCRDEEQKSTMKIYLSLLVLVSISSDIVFAIHFEDDAAASVANLEQIK